MPALDLPRAERMPSPFSPSLRLLTSLELNSRYARSRLSYTRQPPLPPVHLLPSLQSLSLLYVPSDYLPVPRCSSLTSLTLWAPESSALSSLAFSSSSPSSSSGSLASLSFFPSHSSLSLHSCTIDPYELRSLSRSLHSLTHLTIHSCPLVSSHSLVPILQSNPALSSLSLHGTNYCLFAAQRFRSLLSHSSSQLHSLHLSGLPSFHPGLLAACSALRSLSLEGVGISSDSRLPRTVTLDGLVGMLVRVERRGGAGGKARGGAGAEAGGKAGGRAGGKAKEDGGADVSERAEPGAPAVAAEAQVSSRGGDKQWGRYVDIRREAAAAQEDKLVAAKNIIPLMRAAHQATRTAHSDALSAARVEGVNAVPRIVASFGKIRFGVSACRTFCAGVREANAAIKWEEALMRAFAVAGASGGGGGGAAAAAAFAARRHAAGFFTTELNLEEEEDGDGEETEAGDGSRGMDDMLSHDGLSEGVLGGVWSGAVETRAEGVERLHALIDELGEHTNAMSASFNSMRPLTPTLPWPLIDAASAGGGAAGGGAAIPGGGEGGATAHGVAAVREGRAAVHGARGGAAEASPRVESTPEDSGLGEAAAGEAAAGEAAAGNAAAGETAPGDAKPSSGKSSFRHSEGSKAAAAVPVQVYCPPLESLTLRSLRFASPPHVPWLPPSLSSDCSLQAPQAPRLGVLRRVEGAGVAGTLRSMLQVGGAKGVRK
ncbi:unnamed protein product [Closterium sp. Naga37s-1]|nr:unnamed protein product [Closterium sp. Naga37s-1]